jgi:transposase
MATPATPRIAQHTLTQPTLSLAFALGKNTWKLGFTIGVAQQPRARTMPAGAVAGLPQEIRRAKQRFGLPEDTRVVRCSEAGRAGCWLHRSCVTPGVEHLVIDSASLAVHRRPRRAKTDRLAVPKRLTRLRRHMTGEKKVWSVVRGPRVAEDDRRPLHRALTTATGDRTRVSNRLTGLLAGSGVQRALRGAVEAQREPGQQWDGSPLPPALRTRLKRAWQQVSLLTTPLQTLEAERRALVRRREDPGLDQVRQRFLRRGIGVQSAWLYGMACFAGRDVQTPKHVGALAGLTPTPYQRGQSRRALGLATAGHRHRRAMAIASAWAWRRFQPARALCRWDERRCGSGRARLRQLGMVALARKLLLALWRFCKTGVLPEGAVLQAEGPRREGRRSRVRSGGTDRTVASARRTRSQQGWPVCGRERLVVEPGAPGAPGWRGGRSPRRFTRRLRAQTGGGAGRQRRQHGEQVVWGEKAPRVTKPAAHITCRAPRRARHPAASRVRQESAQQGHGAGASARRVRGTQEVEIAPGRVRRAANPLVDVTSMCERASHTHQERSGRDKKRQTSAPKGLTIAAT